MDILGAKKDFRVYSSNWSNFVHGKCNITPDKEGLNIDLYVFEQLCHIVDGALEIDKSYSKGDTVNGPKHSSHFTGVIPYNKISK